MTNLARISCTPPELVYMLASACYTRLQYRTWPTFRDIITKWGYKITTSISCAWASVLMHKAWNRFTEACLNNFVHTRTFTAEKAREKEVVWILWVKMMPHQSQNKYLRRWSNRLVHAASCQVPLSCCTFCLKRQTSLSHFMSSFTFSRESHPTCCQSVDALYKANSITGTVSVHLSAGCTLHHTMSCHHTSIAPMRRVADSRTITVPKLSLGIWYIPATTKSDLAFRLQLQRSSWCSQLLSTCTNQRRVFFPPYREAETASTIANLSAILLIHKLTCCCGVTCSVPACLFVHLPSKVK